MALPSTKRPAIIEEEKAQGGPAFVGKLRLNRYDLFMGAMVCWYQYLGDNEAARLTPRKLKRRAVLELHKLNYEYDRLPLDWVSKLVEKTGMKLYEKRKKMDLDLTNIRVKVDPLIGNITGIVKIKMEPKEKTKATEWTEGEEPKEEKLPEVPDAAVEDKAKGGEKRNGAKKELVDLPSKKQKIIDLSNEPPPPNWLAALAKGEHPTRSLLIHSDKDRGRIIIFWDYQPKFQEEWIKDWHQKVHDGNSFKWWEDDS